MSTGEDRLRYDELLEHYKKELAHFQFVRKKEMILKLAQKLKEAGTPDHHICSILVNDLRDFDVNRDYIREVLPKELRNPYKKPDRKPKPDLKSGENPEFADKIPIEVTTSGIEVRQKQPEPDKESLPSDTDPLARMSQLGLKIERLAAENQDKEEWIGLNDQVIQSLKFLKARVVELEGKLKQSQENNEGLKLENGRLVESAVEQKQQFAELVQSTNLLAADRNAKNKDVKDSLEYKALESELYLIKEERDELKQIATKQIKEHPEQTFQSASTIQAKPENTGKLNGEVEFPAKDLSTMFLDSRNAKKCMFLTIKDSVVVAWQTDVRRNTAN